MQMYIIWKIVMMTIMNSINIILSMLGLGALFMAVFYVLYNEILTSVGYMTTSILSCILVCMINRIHVVMSIQSSIDTLKLENDEWSMTIDDSKKVEQYIKQDMSTLKCTVGIVGENADDVTNNFRNTWQIKDRE